MTRANSENSSGAGSVFNVGLLFLLASATLAIIHVIHWLRFAVYPSFSTADLFAYLGVGQPAVRWAGVQEMLDWLMAVSAAANLFWLGIAIIVVSAQLWERQPKRPVGQARI
jgi:hypothetical protein